jgi:signal transduction histidine kinase
VLGPLARLRAGVHRIAAGDFSHRLDATGCTEFSALSDDFNRTAAELHDLYAELEARIREKSRQLARSEQLASVGCLAAAVAHEINNPLGIIVGYAESGARIAGDGQHATAPEITEALEIIREEAFRGKKITTQLLALSRVSDEPVESVSLARVVDEVADMLRGLSKYADRRIEVVCEDAAGLPVRASALEMKQAILNLTVNALDAVPPRTGEVTLYGRRVREDVMLTVRDNGRGMSSEVLDKVFQPFFSDRRSQGGEGIGLGMSITQAIVERHGGTLTAASAGVGQGSAFTLRLPVDAPTEGVTVETSA